ncbi:hypothetical protein AB4Z27_29495, partial [Cupriavidus sp. KB_39]|uniref:hypothetical protein n=1 Tax=Cupriavidus sp. KB_39 TaxID=3233036 RepID=UPI003F91C1A1
QPIVLALDGAHLPQGRVFAEQVANVMQTEVLAPEFASRSCSRSTAPTCRRAASSRSRWRT